MKIDPRANRVTASKLVSRISSVSQQRSTVTLRYRKVRVMREILDSSFNFCLIIITTVLEPSLADRPSMNVSFRAKTHRIAK